MNWGLLNEKNINKYKYIFIRTSCLYKLYNVHFALMVYSRGCNLMPNKLNNQNDEYDYSNYYKIWREGYIPTHYSYIKKLHKKIAYLENKLKKKERNYA